MGRSLRTGRFDLAHGLTFSFPAVHCKAIKGAVGLDKNAQERNEERFFQLLTHTHKIHIRRSKSSGLISFWKASNKRTKIRYTIGSLFKPLGAYLENEKIQQGVRLIK